ncbi:hypothetical protein II906_05215 [bacterium]|nr:hypothetical protein [bacterium]
MKKLIFALFAVCLIVIPVFAKIEFKKAPPPDPLYLSSPVRDYEEEQAQVVEKEKDPRTLNEKIRAKLHLPPTKKVYYHNIDKSGQPITMDEYYALAAEKLRKDFVIPEPEFEQEEGFDLPDPHFRVIRYNTPPGQRNLDTTKLVSEHKANSAGILSPDKSKMVYTQSVFFPMYAQTASSAYFIPIDKEQDAYDILYKVNAVQQEMKPIVTVGMEGFLKNQFKTLFPIDWSKDSTKIAFKEKVGSNLFDVWQTNVIIYDFNTGKWKRLTAVREAIIYYWRKQNIDLKDYLWDIYPVGWDKNEPDNLVVYAYAFTDTRPLFLGTWSIDFIEEKSKLISPSATSVQIDLNGFGLKEIKWEH